MQYNKETETPHHHLLCVLGHRYQAVEHGKHPTNDLYSNIGLMLRKSNESQRVYNVHRNLRKNGQVE